LKRSIYEFCVGLPGWRPMHGKKKYCAVYTNY
jgi:hypothetical protein